MGKLIVVEGACDGIGKTTQYELLKKELENQNINISTHHFPTYNEFQGKAVEEYLAGKFGKPSELSPYFINALYAEDRAVTWYNKLKKEYDQGKTILLDRYTTSSLIYQSALITDIEEKNKFINFVEDFEYNKLGIKKPDITIFLYADFDLITNLRKQRKSNEGVENDIHERDLEFMRSVYNSGMYVADYLGWAKIKCDENNQLKSRDVIHEEIMKIIQL